MFVGELKKSEPQGGSSPGKISGGGSCSSRPVSVLGFKYLPQVIL